MNKKLLFFTLSIIAFGVNLCAQNCNPFVDTTAKNIVCKDSVQLNAGFSKINKTNLGNGNLRTVLFSKSNNGFILRSDSIFKTSNGGISWTSQKIYNDMFYSDMSRPCGFFIGENIGYIIGANGDSLIMKTTDGGNTWTESNSDYAYYYSTYFTSADTGYVTGFIAWGLSYSMRMVSKTTDGGNSWTPYIFQNNFNQLYSIYFTNASTGYAAGANGNIVKTSNAGTTWTDLTSNVSSDLQSIHFVNQDTGFVVGNGGVILKTVDAGNHWIPLNSRTVNKLSSVYFTNENDGYIAGDKIILKTNNGGNSWAPLFVDLNVDYNSIYFSDSLTGFAVGTNGTVLKITDIDSATYSWQPTAGLDNPNIANPIAKPTAATTYKVTITPNSGTGCSSVYTDSVKVNYAPFATPEICLVSVRDNKNLVVWEKPISTNIDSFYIWRETDVANVYEKVGSTAYSDSSLFVDNTSNPDIQSNKYKISILDECGMESGKSNNAHKTMHLSINQGTTANTWNLIWEAYEGFTVSTYKIFRGTSRDNMTLIGTASGSGSTQYSDYSAPSGYVYYQVQVVSPNSCNPSKSMNTIESNVATNNPNGISENLSAQGPEVFPNPTTGIVSVKFLDKNNQIQSLIITDILGNIVYTETISNQTFANLNLSSLSNGIYSLTVSNSKSSATKKIIIQK